MDWTSGIEKENGQRWVHRLTGSELEEGDIIMSCYTDREEPRRNESWQNKRYIIGLSMPLNNMLDRQPTLRYSVLRSKTSENEFGEVSP